MNTIVSSAISLPEGPLLLPDGSWMVVELDPRRGTVTRIGADGGREPVAETGRPNGLARTADGSIWVAESLHPGIFRIDPEGKLDRVLGEVEGEPLLWPNDLCVGPDGALYVTDSGLRVEELLSDVVANEVRDDWEDLTLDGRLVRFDPVSGEAAFLDRGYQFTNGIAFGPDGMLYVNETFTANVYRYRIEDGAVVGGRELFANVLDPDFPGPGMRGPDGMAFSADGRLWVAVFNQGDVTVLDPDGAVERRIKLPGNNPTNVAFGPPGDTRIYVTEGDVGSLEAREVGVGGHPLHA
ncbi:MAG TPA: SMP-30/gluconolactonase/LRE family protein [Solirubrobacterales bacterium]|nr:SMP-30/gluconolactonase/LRE family protein [Solirubrobacterales bacterium]